MKKIALAGPTLPVWNLRNYRLDKFSSAEPVAPNDTFETKVLAGVESLRAAQKKQETDIQKVLGDLDRSDKEVKKALEELTLVKNTANSSHEEVMRKIEKVQKQVALNARSSFRNPMQRALADEQFRFTLNALGRYIVAMSIKGVKLDDAHKKVVEDAGIAQKALTGIDSGLGQATVPTDTFNMIYDLLLEYGDFSTLGIERVGARTNVLPVATGRPQFYWIGSQSSVAEGGQITAGAFTGSQVLLIIQTLAVLMYIARELLQDSTVDLAPYVLRQMVQSVNWGMDTAAFIGTGNQDTTNAGYVGIFNAALANTNLAFVAPAGRTTVAALKLDDFVNTVLTVSPEVLNRKPMWWAHTQNIARAVLIRDNNGRPIFQTWQEVPTPGSIGSILGYPVHPTAIAPSTDGVNTTPFAFGDPEGQAVGIRSDLELATSADIGFPQNLLAYRTLMRAGVKMKTLPASTILKPFAVLTTPAA
jgi:HK97 family phage major capsid protein